MMTCPAMFAFMEGLGGSEVALIFVIVLLLFGGDKLPEFARGAGKMIREFKKAAGGVEDEFKRALEEEPEKNKIAPPSSIPRIEPFPVETPALESSPTLALNAAPPSSDPAASSELLPATPPPASASIPPAAQPPSPPKMLPGDGRDHLS